MTADEHNKRVLQGVAYLTEWAKHVVTIASALMVLAATLLKDLAKAVIPLASYFVATALLLFYVSMIISVMFALKLVRRCANTVITTQTQMAPGEELAALRTQLGRTQWAFVIGLGFFSIVALSILASWTTTAHVLPTSAVNSGLSSHSRDAQSGQ